MESAPVMVGILPMSNRRDSIIAQQRKWRPNKKKKTCILNKAYGKTVEFIF
jgi:hypothetical protein